MSTPVNVAMFTILNMSTFKDRLEEAARDKGVSIPQARADLKKLLGGTRSNQTHWWTGRAKEPKGGAAAIAADYFNVNALWLAKGVGDKASRRVKEGKKLAAKFDNLDEGEIETVLSMYFEMAPEARAVGRRQWSDLLELTGKPSRKNPFGRGKVARKKRPPGRKPPRQDVAK
jgi:hypothetical protein